MIWLSIKRIQDLELWSINICCFQLTESSDLWSREQEQRTGIFVELVNDWCENQMNFFFITVNCGGSYILTLEKCRTSISWTCIRSEKMWYINKKWNQRICHGIKWCWNQWKFFLFWSWSLIGLMTLFTNSLIIGMWDPSDD